MSPFLETFANAADGVFIIDENQRIIFWNQSAKEILDYEPSQIAGKYCHEVLEGYNGDGKLVCRRHCWIAMAALRGETVDTFDLHARTRTGKRLWVSVSILAFSPDREGERKWVVHLFRDVNKKRVEERLIVQALEAIRKLQQEDPFSSRARSEASEQPVEELTKRETEVLTLLASGQSTREIAGTLSISASTTRNHIQSILRKLGAHSRLEAVVYALELNII